MEEYEARDVESLRLGRDADKLAVVVDPAGYCWEVLERHERQVTEPLCKVCCALTAQLELVREASCSGSGQCVEIGGLVLHCMCCAQFEPSFLSMIKHSCRLTVGCCAVTGDAARSWGPRGPHQVLQ